MSPDGERFWLREWGLRKRLAVLGPVAALMLIYVLMVLDSSGATIVRETLLVLIALPAFFALSIRRNSVTVDTHTGVIVRRHFPRSERIDAHQRLKVDVRRDEPLTYVFVRKLNGTETYDVLCDGRVLVWRSAGSAKAGIVARLRTLSR